MRIIGIPQFWLVRKITRVYVETGIIAQGGNVKHFLAIAVIAAFGTTGAFAKDITVKSWCPMTKASGIGKGATFDVAKDLAIKKCLANGGLMSCCPKFTRQI